MNRARLVGFLRTAVAAGLLSACAETGQDSRAVPDPKSATLVVLLPDEDGGGTGPSTELRAGPRHCFFEQRIE